MNSAEHLPGAHLPWLEHLPAHWRVVPFGKVARLSSRANARHDVRLLSLSATRGVLRKEYDDENQVRTGEELARYWVVEPGHLIINPMWLAHGSVGASSISGVISPDYRVYAVSSGDSRFLAYLLKSHEYLGLYQLFVRGDTTYDRRVSKQDFHSIPVVMPPASEQRAIADFLDRKTAALDELIAKKERLADLALKRSKTLAAECVTRGLDPQACLRPSGIEWLGDIPAHWEVLRTRRLCSVTTGTRDTQDAVPDGTYPFFVRSQNIERINTFSFDGEGVLTAGDGVGSVAKVFHYYVGKFEFHQRMYMYYGFTRVLGKYYYYYLREWLAAVAKAGNAKITVDSLRRPMLLDFPVAVPPLTEQREIVASLDSDAAVTQRVRASLLQQIDLLREHRNAVITAAVTGQLDIAAQEAA